MNQHYCCFVLGTQHFIISTDIAFKVLGRTDWVSVPLAPPEVMGLINYRGEVITIIDIKQLFQLPKTPVPNQQIVLLHDTGQYIGIVVDKVTDIHTLATKQLQPPPVDLSPSLRPYIKQVCYVNSQLLLNVDTTSIIHPSEA